MARVDIGLNDRHSSTRSPARACQLRSSTEP